jgi:ubiquinone/menaquinone biosynthesis C-methylase UbiE
MTSDLGVSPYGGSVRFDFINVNAADYARLRPGYAPDAIDWVVARTGTVRGTTVVDVGAGTGQLSKEFVRRSASVWAVEPAANMRAELPMSSPGVRVLDGTGESLPVPDGLAELVVVGQAMHHFEPQAALAEIHRVLMPDGALAVFWTMYPPDDTIIERVDAIVNRHAPKTDPIRRAVVSRRDSLVDTVLFSKAEVRAFPGQHELASSDLAAMLATWSDVASLPPSRRSALLTEIDAFSGSLAERVSVPMTTEVHLCFPR